MKKKLLLTSLLLSFIYYTPAIAQNYDHKIKVTITITDEIIPTRPASIIQHHTLSFEEHPNFVFGIDDKVGFEFYIDNQSQSGKTFHYEVGYYPRNEANTSSSDTTPTGVVAPITLPPVDDDEDESQDQNGPISAYPYTAEGEYLDWESRIGSQLLEVILFVKKDNSNDYMIADQIYNIFQVFYNVSPANGVNAKDDKNDIIVYPNPIGPHLYIESEKTIQNNSTATIEVYTMQGILLKKSSMQAIHKDHTSYYDFTNPSTLKRGTYVYKIIIDGETYIKLLQKK